MTSTDRNDLMPAQEKMKWVTPKISLMEAEDTEGKLNFAANERTRNDPKFNPIYGPS